MSRDYLLYLEDIELALDRIERYTQGQSFAAFSVMDAGLIGLVANPRIASESFCVTLL